MTQKQRIVKALIKGKLTTLTGALRGLGTKAPTRIGELERELNVKFNREPKKNKTSHWLEYSVNKKDLKKLNKYLQVNN